MFDIHEVQYVQPSSSSTTTPKTTTKKDFKKNANINKPTSTARRAIIENHLKSFENMFNDGIDSSDDEHNNSKDGSPVKKMKSVDSQDNGGGEGKDDKKKLSSHLDLSQLMWNGKKKNESSDDDAEVSVIGYQSLSSIGGGGAVDGAPATPLNNNNPIKVSVRPRLSRMSSQNSLKKRRSNSTKRGSKSSLMSPGARSSTTTGRSSTRRKKDLEKDQDGGDKTKKRTTTSRRETRSISTGLDVTPHHAHNRRTLALHNSKRGLTAATSNKEEEHGSSVTRKQTNKGSLDTLLSKRGQSRRILSSCSRSVGDMPRRCAKSSGEKELDKMKSTSRRAMVLQSLANTDNNDDSLSLLDLKDHDDNFLDKKIVQDHSDHHNNSISSTQLSSLMGSTTSSCTSDDDESISILDESSSKSHSTDIGGGGNGNGGSCSKMTTSGISLLNEEREKFGLKPLTRDQDMDAQARKYAKMIADSGGQQVLKTSDYHGGHVLRGLSINSIHAKILERKTHHAKDNLLNPNFHTMGLGIARDEKNNSGKIYLCELFKGDVELTCMDVE